MRSSENDPILLVGVGKNKNEEIPDFKITVTKQNENIVYSSEETIRKE